MTSLNTVLEALRSLTESEAEAIDVAPRPGDVPHSLAVKSRDCAVPVDQRAPALKQRRDEVWDHRRVLGEMVLTRAEHVEEAQRDSLQP